LQVDTAAASRGCPVIGIGGSAGGIEALKLLLPVFGGHDLVVVIATHQPSDRDGELAGFLQRFTRLEVLEASARERMKPRRAYVLPRSEYFGIEDDFLVHQPGPWRRSRNIDHFFASLAAARGDRAIGVVRSGADDDGTAGLAAIQAAGGRTFVQAPRTALFARMPASAAKNAGRSLEARQLGAELMRTLVDISK
jgi:chemotaxis response regulator CheB